jgi:hypothetical protein
VKLLLVEVVHVVMAFFTMSNVRFVAPLIGKPCLLASKWDILAKHEGKGKAKKIS